MEDIGIYCVYGIGDVGIPVSFDVNKLGSNVGDDFNHILSFYDIIMIKKTVRI